MTPGMKRVLSILCLDGAYALPNGAISRRFLLDGHASLSGEWAISFEKKGWIEKKAPPREEVGRVFVWKITPAGRHLIAQFEPRDRGQRWINQTTKME